MWKGLFEIYFERKVQRELSRVGGKCYGFSFHFCFPHLESTFKEALSIHKNSLFHLEVNFFYYAQSSSDWLHVFTISFHENSRQNGNLEQLIKSWHSRLLSDERFGFLFRLGVCMFSAAGRNIEFFDFKFGRGRLLSATLTKLKRPLTQQGLVILRIRARHWQILWFC